MRAALIKIGIGALAVLALLAALFYGEQYIEGRGYDRAKAEDATQIERNKRQAADQLATETKRAGDAEAALQAMKNTQDLKDAENEKTVADLSDRLHRAAGPAGRLRDPHATGCGAGGGSAPGKAPTAPGEGPKDRAEAGGLLSAELTGLLQRLTREADEINTAYASCRTDAYTVRAPH